MYTTKSNKEIGIVVGVIVLIIIFAVWYYMTHNSVACTDSTGCTVGANLACISGKCGPVTCTKDGECTTAPNTICDVTSGSKTFGICIPPGSCKDSSTCTDVNNPACVGGVCSTVQCTTADQATKCTSPQICSTTAIGTPTYGICVAPPPVPCKDASECTTVVNNPACVNKLCSPVQCTKDSQCTTAPNTICDIYSISKTFGTCIPPSDCTNSSGCTDVNYPACVGGVCSTVQCTTANQASTCTSPQICSTAAIGTATYGICVAPPVPCKDSNSCKDVNNRACVNKVCSPVQCTRDSQCTTAPNTVCDVYRRSQTFGTCIQPEECTDSSSCTDVNYPACVGGVCSPVQCTIANQKTACTSTQICSTAAIGTATYGTCVTSPYMRRIRY